MSELMLSLPGAVATVGVSGGLMEFPGISNRE